MTRKFNPKIADEGRKIIGKFLRDRREELGWSQQQLAECAGVKRLTIIHVEAGKPSETNTLLAILGCMRGKIFIEWQDINSVAGMEPMGKN